MSDLLPFGLGAWLFVAVYLSSLLLLGWAGFRSREENSLRDFYLGGQGFGFMVLFLTLYATQYSGNSVFGVTGATYREGFGWLIAMHYMLAIVVVYLAFAPKLRAIARRDGYVTPVDFLTARYRSAGLSLFASIVMIAALSNYLLAQLMAMGRALQGLAGPYGEVAYLYGVGALALIMLVYGTLGGIRAIAWTDAIQGGVLLVGFMVLLGLLPPYTLDDVKRAYLDKVRTAHPDHGGDLDDFRNPQHVAKLVKKIAKRSQKSWTLMEIRPRG